MRDPVMRAGPIFALLALSLVATAAPALAQSPSGAVADHMTPSRELDQETLGGRGLQKCNAYKRVRRHTDELQAADNGQLTPADTRRLMAELKHARAMPPRHLTPADCGVPL